MKDVFASPVKEGNHEPIWQEKIFGLKLCDLLSDLFNSMWEKEKHALQIFRSWKLKYFKD